jgi:hypothetical protein
VTAVDFTKRGRQQLPGFAGDVYEQAPCNVPAEVLPTLGATVLVAVALAAPALLLFLGIHAAP